MKISSSTWCVFLADNGVSFTIGVHQSEKEQQIGFVPLDEGIIVKGYIKDPIALKNSLKKVKKEYDIKSPNVRIVLGEENIHIKRMIIKKAELHNDKLRDYIYSQLGLTIHFPYKTPVLDFYVIEERESEYDVMIFISDDNLIQDYLDMFESIHVRHIEFDNSYIANYRLYYHYRDQKNNDLPEIKQMLKDYVPEETGLMFVSIYHNILTIAIFDRMIPSFTLVEELEEDGFCESVVSYIEKIANYYQYNIHKGLQKVRNIVVFDYRDCSKMTEVKQNLRSKITDFKVNYFDFKQIESFDTKLCHKGFFMAFSSSLKD